MGDQKQPDQRTILEAAKKGRILDWSDDPSLYEAPKNVISISKAKEKKGEKR